MTGSCWFIGCPASGKTTLARALAIEAQRKNRWPILVIDTEGAAQLDGFPRVRGAAQAADRVWTKRQNASVEPQDADQVLALIEACRVGGHVNVLIDEAHVWFDATSGGQLRKAILRLMRAHRHSKVCLFLTTQHLSGDIPQAALACSPTLFVFRCTSPATLDRLESSFGIDANRVRNLGQFKYLRFFEGFGTSGA